jgi:uncharacterized protein (DUF2141 family)
MKRGLVRLRAGMHPGMWRGLFVLGDHLFEGVDLPGHRLTRAQIVAAMKKYAFALLLPWFWCCAASAQQASATLTLTVVGAQANVGQIIASLFDSKATYMRQSIVTKTRAVGADGTVVIDFGEHPHGDYAVSLIYDKNANGKLDTGFMRIPKEKFGFSNNAKGRFGPAKWKHARFVLNGASLKLQIRLAVARGNL